MEKHEYEMMFNVEDNFWWYVGLREAIFSLIKKYSPKHEHSRLLDAGCGTGATLARSPLQPAYGFDISREAIKFSKFRKLRNITVASVCEIPYLSDTFDVAVSLDVLCQISKNDVKIALEELYRILNKKGILLLNLPAFNFLRSRHDRAVHIQHRYRRKELKRMMKKAGFEVERVTYRNSFLFPFFMVMRVISALTLKDTPEVKSDIKHLPSAMNRFLALMLSVENQMILTGIDFPFGLSLICVARKKG